MAPASSAKAQSINEVWQKKVQQRKLKKIRNKKKKKQQESGLTTPSKTHRELAGDHNTKRDQEEDICSSGCSTPKAERFKIPEILSCPPAPKKTRVIQNYSSIRSPIAFFSSPDIELFFSSLRNVSA
ncbi:cyclin-dependent protein kinase inhibitor SMR9-like [Prosopis cineraria]|uniref:cyclin-dependent protein kinase inhibitor SMR9-like n=1 Tax=Prosopis cineraria TaxID=364024 RepID=UPI00240EE660|nr:cyclin-dependent protein kinase inhibitor SMR9-like [Prosopis cineraria]